MDDKGSKKYVLVITCDGTELQLQNYFYVCVLCVITACILCLFVFSKKIKRFQTNKKNDKISRTLLSIHMPKVKCCRIFHFIFSFVDLLPYVR
jgi:surface polysaccharide O-acyltransferase-like enzyme